MSLVLKPVRIDDGLTRQQGVRVLAVRDVLEELAPSDRMRLLAHAKPRHFADGEVILAEGVSNRTLFFVMDGEVEVGTRAPTISEEDHYVVLATVGVGMVLGEMTLLTQAPTSARCLARGPVETLALEHRQLVELVDTEPALAARFYRSIAITLANRLMAANENAALASASTV